MRIGVCPWRFRTACAFATIPSAWTHLSCGRRCHQRHVGFRASPGPDHAPALRFCCARDRACALCQKDPSLRVYVVELGLSWTGQRLNSQRPLRITIAGSLSLNWGQLGATFAYPLVGAMLWLAANVVGQFAHGSHAPCMFPQQTMY